MFDNYAFTSCPFSILQGKVPIYINVSQKSGGRDNILMLFSDGLLIKLHHQQDCCESVWGYH